MDLTVEFIDSENEVEIDNMELPPTQDSDLEIIENSDLDLVHVSEVEDSVDRLLQGVFPPAASSTQNRDPGLESLEPVSIGDYNAGFFGIPYHTRRR